MERGNKDKAKKEFTAAISLGERQSFNYNLGLLSMDEGDYELAEDFFLSAIVSPASLNAPSRAGESYEKLADLYINNLSEFPEERQVHVLEVIDYYKRKNKNKNSPGCLK